MVAFRPFIEPPAASGLPAGIALRRMSLLSAPDAAALMVRVARDGDRAAFAAIYRHFAPRVRSWLLRRGARASQAEEVLHEVMWTVWRRADRYDPDRAAVSTWVFTIARNRHIDRIRRVARPEPDPDDPHFVPAAPRAADEAVAVQQATAQLTAAIAQLPDEQALVIRRAWLEGATLREISDETDTPLGTIKSRSRLAMNALRRTLGEVSP